MTPSSTSIRINSSREFQRWLCFAWLAFAIWSSFPYGAHAGAVDVLQARIEKAEDGYRFAGEFAFDISRELEDGIVRGIPVTFATEVVVTQPRWYWLDEKVVHAMQSVRVTYNVWTRQYNATINGGAQRSFTNLEDALALILKPQQWRISEKAALKAGEIYSVGVRLRLDINQLPKPILLTALNDKDWRLSSEWKRFNFKADDK
jgi:hypothetical protein